MKFKEERFNKIKITLVINDEQTGIKRQVAYYLDALQFEQSNIPVEDYIESVVADVKPLIVNEVKRILNFER